MGRKRARERDVVSSRVPLDAGRTSALLLARSGSVRVALRNTCFVVAGVLSRNRRDASEIPSEHLRSLGRRLCRLSTMDQSITMRRDGLGSHGDSKRTEAFAFEIGERER